MRKLFLLLMTLIACCWNIQAQTKTISGSVVDATNGEPLIGATIMPIGGGQGAAADVDGNFSITVPASVKKATVSYVGYTSQTVDLKPGMVVKLVSAETTLDNVVVVAYGTTTKEALTGSVAVVGSKEIEERPVTSVTQALEGSAPGVQVNSSTGTPGSAPTIRIRGFNSFSNNTPLYVVDGVPYEGSVNEINPADVESMSVLKDAASCALYGNRGANGVILITTKKAKKKDKVDVTLTMRQGMYTRGLPMYDRLAPNEWMQATFDGLVNGGMSTETYADRQAAIDFYRANYLTAYAKANIYGGLIRDNDGNVINHVGYGVGADYGDDQLFDATGRFVPSNYLPGYAGDLDWWDAVSRTGHRQEYNVNAAAASERYNVFASAGYLKENGYMYQTDFERFNGRLNANFTPTSYLRFGLNLAATTQESETGQTGSDLGLASNPFLTQGYAPIYPYYAHDALGNIVYGEDGKPMWNTATYMQGTNVAWVMRLNKNNYSSTVIDANIYGTAVIPYGFELTVRGSMHRDKTHSMSYTNNIVGDAKDANGTLAEGWANYKSHTFMQTLDWSHDYGVHHVEALLDHENWQYSEDSASASMYDQVFEDIYAFSNFNNTQTTPSQSQGMIRTESYLGRVRYNYDGRYFGEASIRRDGTSRFAKKNHWGNFWSVGASWILTREKFLQNVNWLNYLKFRAAYGSVGNDGAASAYASYAQYGFTSYDGYRVLLPVNLASDNTKWEATKTLDLALEGSLFNDRLNFSIGYFNKRNSDLLYNVTQASSVGAVGMDGYNPSVLTNIGTMQNIGWELMFGVNILRTADWKWDFNIDATLYKNKVVKLPYGRDLPGSALFQGEAMYVHYNYDWAGVDRLTGRSVYAMNPDSYDFKTLNDAGEYVFSEDMWVEQVNAAKAAGAYLELDGAPYTTNPSFAGRKILGTSLPTVYGSFSTNVSWKNLSLGLLFTYGLGGKTLDSVYQGLMSMSKSSASALHKDVLKGWTTPAEGVDPNSLSSRVDPNGVPQINPETVQQDFYESSQFLTSSSYLTLKNINLTWDLPMKWVRPLQVQNINLAFQVDNMFIISKRKGMNPTYGYAGGQGNNYVPARVFSFQLGVRF
ncbi:MAG: SusC/RagA family TonB-linked outer membrane protein [Bacteroides sp.]|nr:SusC/RagA family TonB-linked outer membrane protein [Bacteroides sp.]MBD5306479.1 SusC/RagA family TonB-linked outer membrane protein [Bacteroides sp.]